MANISTPGGVKLVALYHFIFGAYAAFFTFMAFVVFVGGGTGGSMFFPSTGRGVWALVTLVAGTICFGSFGIGMGLVRGKKSARAIAIVLSLFTCLALWGSGSWVWLLFHLTTVAYLSFNKQVSLAFN